MGSAVSSDYHHRLSSGFAVGEDCGERDFHGLGDGPRGDGDFGRSTGLVGASFGGDADPDLNSGAAGVERGADEVDLGGDGPVDTIDGDEGRVTDLEALGDGLGEMDLREERRG